MPGKLVFVINNAQPTPMNSESEFYVFFDPARGAKSYRLNLQNMMVESYENGQFTTSVQGADSRAWQPAGPLDPASGIQDDGSVWLVIDKTRPEFDIETGDALLGVFIREGTVGNPSRILASDFAGGLQDYVVVGNDFCARTPLEVASRKTHGGKGPFDVDLKSPAPGIECRAGGATGDHTVVLEFALPVTVAGNGTVKAEVTSGTGEVGSGGSANGNAVTVNGAVVTVPLTNVANAQRLSLSLYGVSDGTNTAEVSIPLSVLLSDVDASGRVDGGDVLLTRQQSLKPATEDNFRGDVNVSGRIDGGDTLITRQQSFEGVPAARTPRKRARSR